MKLAIWTAILVELEPAEAVAQLAAQGWDGLELSTEHIVAIEEAGRPEEIADEVREVLEESNCVMPQVHLLISANVAAADEFERRRDMASVRRQIELCSRMGVRIGVIHPGGDQPDAFADELAERERRVESFRKLADYAAQFDFSLAIENMTDGARDRRSSVGQRRYGATIEELHALIDAIDRPNVGICLDVGHAHVQGIDMAEGVRQCGDRLIATHIQDNDGRSDQHLAPIRGSIDWTAGIAALRETGYEGLFNLEIPGERGLPPNLTLKRLEGVLETARWLLTQSQEGT
ncbi:MAG: sugar phosphate isomerase/epimerase family protein [Armatimonadota bacterium]